MTEVDSRVARARIEFGSDGLVPVVAQDESSGEVLMLAYANREALERTVGSGRAHYFSRSRGRLWRKGDSSGNFQYVSRVAVDCDGDALIYFVKQVGAACHTGERSCFFRSEEVTGDGSSEGRTASTTPESPESLAGSPDQAREAERRLVLGRAFALLEGVVEERLRQLPENSYVAALHERGFGYIAQKVVEEAGETVVAALEGGEDRLTEESADLLFHLVVLLRESGQSLSTVAALLESRHHERGGGSKPRA